MACDDCETNLGFWESRDSDYCAECHGFRMDHTEGAKCEKFVSMNADDDADDDAGNETERKENK